MPTFTPVDYDPFEVKPQPEEKSKAGVLRTIGDIAIGVSQGAIGALKTGGDLAAGLGLADAKNGVSEGARKASEVLEGFKSKALLDEKAAMQQRIAAADGGLAKFGEAASSYLTNQRLALDMAASNAAMLMPSAAAGRFAGAASKALGATEAAAGKVGLGAAIGTGATQQATDVSRGAYDSAIADGATPEQAMSAARAAFAPAAGVSVAAQFLPGGQSIERALAGGAARNAIQGGVLNRVYAGAKGAIGEGISEGIEEGGGQIASNVAQQQYSNPNKGTWDGVAETAGQALAGGVLLGGPAGLASGTEIVPAKDAGASQQAPTPEAGAHASQQSTPAPTTVVDPNAGVLSRGIAEMHGGDAITPVNVPVPQAAPEQSTADSAPDKQAQKEEKQASREAFVDDFVDNQVATAGEVSKEAAAAVQITPAEVREGVQRHVEAANGPAPDVQPIEPPATESPDAPARLEPTIEEKLDTAVRSGLRSGGINRKGIAQALGVGIADVSNAVKRVRKQDFDAQQAETAPAVKPDAPVASSKTEPTAPAVDSVAAPAPEKPKPDQRAQSEAKAALDSQAQFAQQVANSPPVKVDEQAAQAVGSQGDAITPPAINPPTVNEISNGQDESSNAGQSIGIRQTNNDGTQAESATVPAENSGIGQGTAQEIEAVPAASTELQPERTPAVNDSPVYSDSTEVLDDDITPPSGAFSIRENAEAQARRVDGGKVFEVDDGYVVRVPKRTQGTVPAALATSNAEVLPESNAAPATKTPLSAELPAMAEPIPDAPRATDAHVASNDAQPVQKPAPKAKAPIRAPRRYSAEELEGKFVNERIRDVDGKPLTFNGPAERHPGRRSAAESVQENDSLTKSYRALLKCLKGGGK